MYLFIIIILYITMDFNIVDYMSVYYIIGNILFTYCVINNWHTQICVCIEVYNNILGFVIIRGFNVKYDIYNIKACINVNNKQNRYVHITLFVIRYWWFVFLVISFL